MINNWFFKQIDNSSLIVFRIFFGILITAESFGAILTGWVNNVLITPKFTFTFIGFDWLQPQDEWMYIYYVVMGICGVLGAKRQCATPREAGTVPDKRQPRPETIPPCRCGPPLRARQDAPRGAGRGGDSF